MAVDLVGHLQRLARRVETQEFPGAAERMADALREGASAAMGGDLTFSGGAGSAVIQGTSRGDHIAVTVAGAYALADTGRRRAVPATATGRALRTPYGPRRSVRGSTWGGFGITQRYGREALRVGIEAVVDEVDWGH